MSESGESTGGSVTRVSKETSEEGSRATGEKDPVSERRVPKKKRLDKTGSASGSSDELSALQRSLRQQQEKHHRPAVRVACGASCLWAGVL